MSRFSAKLSQDLTRSRQKSSAPPGGNPRNARKSDWDTAWASKTQPGATRRDLKTGLGKGAGQVADADRRQACRRRQRGGRPRTISLRDVLNTTLQLVRTGCPWDCAAPRLSAEAHGLQPFPAAPAGRRPARHLDGSEQWRHSASPWGIESRRAAGRAQVTEPGCRSRPGMTRVPSLQPPAGGCVARSCCRARSPRRLTSLVSPTSGIRLGARPEACARAGSGAGRSPAHDGGTHGRHLLDPATVFGVGRAGSPRRHQGQ
jgi:hypothetical protein